MSGSRVARRYAEALFAVARDRGQVDEALADLEQVATALAETPDVRDYFRQPLISRADKRHAIDGAFGESVSELVVDFLRVLVDRMRFAIISDVLLECKRLKDEHDGVVRATIASARELDEAELAQLVAALTHVSGKRVIPRTRVDADLIAGVTVTMGDEVLDGSAKGGLRRLRERLRSASMAGIQIDG